MATNHQPHSISKLEVEEVNAREKKEKKKMNL